MAAIDEQNAYFLPPDVLDPSNRSHTPHTRRFQGIPSLAASANGHLWATWYAGKTPAEDHNNYVVIADSGNGGQTWTERRIIDPGGDQSQDESIYVVYDHGRTGEREILMSKFTEDAALAGNPKRGDVTRKMVVSRCSSNGPHAGYGASDR